MLTWPDKVIKITLWTVALSVTHSVSQLTFTACLVYASVYLLYGLLAFGFRRCVCRYRFSCVYCSVVTDSESATESADSSQVRLSPNLRTFCGRDGFGSSICETIFTYQVVAFKQCCVTVCGRRCGRVGD